MLDTDRRLSWFTKVMVVLVGVYLVIPTLIVIPLSFTDRASFAFPPRGWSLDYYRTFLTEPVWRDALLTSVKLGLAVMVLATVLGSAAAVALVRGKFPGKSLINGLLLAPMIVPVIVIAVATFGVFLRWQLVGSFTGFLLAHTVLALPFVIVTVSSALRTFDDRLELAAASLGAPPMTRLRRVTLPLVLPGVLSGAVFAFVTSFDEVVVALYLQSPDMRTLPVRMYTSVTSETDPTIAAASTLVLVVTTLLILLPQVIRRGDRA
ncbi:ABC transporter permease [Intrasporangium calvum]|uniref:ABC transporter permease n=1 Tax=Intrasporangium calvum TaxID=53358 RepID=UPI000DF5CEAE|nr:ABC transporter permease [Intrasporangium calvum]AXG14530.1 ABC transporter permease [Intrasporangium calvum]